jgi:hypothetical protein
MDYKVTDDFLNQDDYLRIKDTMLAPNFPWYYNDGKSYADDDPRNTLGGYNFQFIHFFYNDFSPNSQYFEILQPLINKIDPLSIVRIKANLTTKTPEKLEGGWHTDYPAESTPKGMRTAVFYVNTNDGYTKFLDGPTVESIGNRFLDFDPNILHTGANSTDTKARVLINLNYFPKL